MVQTVLQHFPLLLGLALAAWPLAARRSRVDAAIIGCASGLLFIIEFYPYAANACVAEVWIELLLALLGIIMFVRLFLTPLGTGHKVGLGLAGCGVMLPFLALAALLAAFGIGSKQHQTPPPTSSPGAGVTAPVPRRAPEASGPRPKEQEEAPKVRPQMGGR